jgi:hypothetical protein
VSNSWIFQNHWIHLFQLHFFVILHFMNHTLIKPQSQYFKYLRERIKWLILL